jgi:hypothetical protein
LQFGDGLAQFPGKAVEDENQYQTDNQLTKKKKERIFVY